jgi:hypothetical protein
MEIIASFHFTRDSGEGQGKERSDPMNKLQVIEYQNQRVLTTAQLAEAFGAESDRISKNFSENRDRYTEGKHFFRLEGESLLHFRNSEPQLEISNMTRVLYLWTEKGAWMHAKSLNTDQAWAAYEALVDDYYNVKSEQIDVSKLDPSLQMFYQVFQSVARTQLQLAETQKELTEVKSTVNAIQETFLQRDEDWRKSINSMLNGAAYRTGEAYRDLRNESYRLLEERGRCDLNTRLRNLKKRLEDAGATKTQINDANKMDVIESDPRLKEIYTTVVKEISIGSLSR